MFAMQGCHDDNNNNNGIKFHRKEGSKIKCFILEQGKRLYRINNYTMGYIRNLNIENRLPFIVLNQNRFIQARSSNR